MLAADRVTEAPGKRRVAITTLGCKVNTFESAQMGQSLTEHGWQLVEADQAADAYVFNTCTVTAEADRQARQLIRRIIRNHPRALIAVTGCYAQMNPEQIAAIPGVDLVLGNNQKLDIANLLPQLEKHQSHQVQVMVDDLDSQSGLPEQLIAGIEGRSRAFLQVQQGCDQGCTFCIIHRARGKSRSIPPTTIKQQAQRLIKNGYRELVLCGIDLGAYGDDFDSRQGSFGLPELIQMLSEQIVEDDNAEFKIRLSSIDPSHISDRLIEQFQVNSRLCHQVHLSMQSGSTMILKRMKRRYTARHMESVIHRLRQVVPDLVLSADVLVGFPTETEQHFAETLAMVKRLEIAYPHTFTFSSRSGTPASRIPADRHIKKVEMKRRAKLVRECGDQIRQQLMIRRLGTVGKILVEHGPAKKNRVRARADDYLPVLVPASIGNRHQWISVKYQAIKGNDLIAEPYG